MNSVCYNCGIPLDKTIRSKEHIPAKNLFQGFPDEFKLNRITVYSCLKCNNDYSKIDQELRNALAVINNGESISKELTSKGIRSILNSSNWKENLFFDLSGNVIAVPFSYNNLKEYHIKNFKGVFLKEYGFIVPDDYSIGIIADGDNNKIESASSLYHYVIANNEIKHSGHPDIFQYALKDITINSSDGEIFESRDSSKWGAVVGILVYHKKMIAIILAGTNEFIEKYRP